MSKNYTTNVELYKKAYENNICLNGIYFKDQLPNIVKNGGYIVNLADHDDGTSGTHWVGFWIEGKKAIYFDPLGVHPPEAVKDFLGNLNLMITTKQVQNEYSGWCGHYLLYFLYYMSHRRKEYPNLFTRVSEFLALFSSEPDDNLTILKCLLKQLR